MPLLPARLLRFWRQILVDWLRRHRKGWIHRFSMDKRLSNVLQACMCMFRDVEKGLVAAVTRIPRA